MKKNKKNKKLLLSTQRDKLKASIMSQVKSARKKSREEEIRLHGKPLNYSKIIDSKKMYKRKINKADDDHLPYLYYLNLYFMPNKKILLGCDIPPKSA